MTIVVIKYYLSSWLTRFESRHIFILKLIAFLCNSDFALCCEVKGCSHVLVSINDNDDNDNDNDNNNDNDNDNDDNDNSNNKFSIMEASI